MSDSAGDPSKPTVLVIGAGGHGGTGLRAWSSLSRTTGRCACSSGPAATTSRSPRDEAISAVIGRVVEFHPISQQDWQRGLEGIADGSTGVVNTAMAQHISAVGAQLAQRAGAAIVPNPLRLAEITGREPQSFAEFVREHREAFIPAGTS